MTDKKTRAIEPRPRRLNYFAGFFAGITAYFRVLPTLFRHRLWPVQFVPALLSLVISSAMFTGFWFIGDGLSRWIDRRVHLPWESVDQAVNSLAGVIAFIFLVMCFLLIHKHLILVLLAPALGKLAEKTYQGVMDDRSTSPLTVPQALWRGLRINTANVTRELFFNFCFLLCNLIPGFGQLIASSGIFLNQSRFMGYGLMDTTLEHAGLTVRESIGFVNRRAGHSTGIGAGYIVLMLIPVIGWMFAPTFGTVAATLVAIDELKRDGRI